MVPSAPMMTDTPCATPVNVYKSGVMGNCTLRLRMICVVSVEEITATVHYDKITSTTRWTEVGSVRENVMNSPQYLH